MQIKLSASEKRSQLSTLPSNPIYPSQSTQPCVPIQSSVVVVYPLPRPLLVGGGSDRPVCGPPASFSVHLASSAVTPAGSIHKSRGDNVVPMWVQNTGEIPVVVCKLFGSDRYLDYIYHVVVTHLECRCTSSFYVFLQPSAHTLSVGLCFWPPSSHECPHITNILLCEAKFRDVLLDGCIDDQLARIALSNILRPECGWLSYSLDRSHGSPLVVQNLARCYP